MAYNTADLPGSGPFYAGLDIYPVETDVAGNRTRFDWVGYIGCSSNGWGTWSGSGQLWYASIAGVALSGSWTLDFRPAGSSGRRYAIASGTLWVGHDADGNRPGFRNDFVVDSDHTSVGDGGVSTWVDAPRIPKPPNAPTLGAPTLIAPTSFRVPFNVGAENGAAITQTKLQWSRNDAFTDIVWTDLINIRGSGYSDPSGAGVALVPGTQYWVRAQSDAYGIGWSPWSNVVSGRTLSSVYAGKSGAFVAGQAMVGKGGSYVPAGGVLVGRGGTYVPAG